MKQKSAIEKGKRFENFVNAEIEAEGLGKATRTPGSGSGRLKGDSFNNLKFMLECKNQKTIHIKEWIDQSKEQAHAGNYDPQKWALIFRDPRTPEARPEVYAVIDFWQFLKLLHKDKEPTIKEPDKDAAWKIRALIEAAKRALKVLEK